MRPQRSGYGPLNFGCETSRGISEEACPVQRKRLRRRLIGLSLLGLLAYAWLKALRAVAAIDAMSSPERRLAASIR